MPNARTLEVMGRALPGRRYPAVRGIQPTPKTGSQFARFVRPQRENLISNALPAIPHPV